MNHNSIGRGYETLGNAPPRLLHYILDFTNVDELYRPSILPNLTVEVITQLHRNAPSAPLCRAHSREVRNFYKKTGTVAQGS